TTTTPWSPRPRPGWPGCARWSSAGKGRRPARAPQPLRRPPVRARAPPGAGADRGRPGRGAAVPAPLAPGVAALDAVPAGPDLVRDRPAVRGGRVHRRGGGVSWVGGGGG